MKLIRTLTAAALMASTYVSNLIAGEAPEIIGYCPVAYVALGEVVKGSPDFTSVIDGKTYWLVNADAKKAFDDNPEKFAVGIDGYCAYAAAKGAVFPGDLQIFSVKNGKIYFFINETTKAAFDKDANMAAQAEANWPELAKSI